MVIISYILKVLELNIFQKKLKNSWKTKILQQIFVEYKHKIRQCMDISVLDLLIFLLKGKSLPDYTILFSPNDYEKNDKIILIYFQQLKYYFCE